MQKERQAKPGVYAMTAVILFWMKVLAKRIARDLENGQWEHCAVYEDELKRVWPLDQKDREAKIAQFAKEYGFRLRHYKKGLCAIFDKRPREIRRGALSKRSLRRQGQLHSRQFF